MTKTTTIEPVVGRVVWYYPRAGRNGADDRQPLAAQIAHVWDDGRINIGYLSPIGVHLNACSLEIWEGEGERPRGPYCEWMPYQKGQAAKTEALEAQLTDNHAV